MADMVQIPTRIGQSVLDASAGLYGDLNLCIACFTFNFSIPVFLGAIWV
jgi:hypothetical protein